MESCFIVIGIEYLVLFLPLTQYTKVLFSRSHWVMPIEKVDLGESSLSDC